MHDVKIIPSEECVTQHKLPVCDAGIVKSKDWCKKFVPKQSHVIIVISFVKLLQVKLMAPQGSK